MTSRLVVHFQAVLAGDYILGISAILLARIGNSEVISLLSRVIQDLVRGIYSLIERLPSDERLNFQVNLCN